MLKITWDLESLPPSLKLHGRIDGAWIGELERAWQGVKFSGSRPVVDLTEVTFVGREGCKVLGGMMREGAELKVGPLMQYTIDRIRREADDSGGDARRGD
jgi:anti-anti-sigma regulatory factor